MVWWIIGAGVVVFGIYFIFLANYMKKRTAKQLAEVASRSSGQPLTPAQERLLVFGAILAQHRSERILSLQPTSALDIIKHGVQNQWEIGGPEDAHETLTDLVSLVRSSEYDEHLVHNTAPAQEAQRAVAKAMKLNLDQVQAVRSTFAWDTCRAVALARWCFWLGYITEAEYWDYLNKAAAQATLHGENWTDYTVSFLVGRTMQGFDLDDIKTDALWVLKGNNKPDGDVYQRYPYKAA